MKRMKTHAKGVVATTTATTKRLGLAATTGVVGGGITMGVVAN